MSEISWLDRDIKRFRESGVLIPPIQRKIYEKIGEEFCSGRTVIDIGCSIGVGSNILSQTARHVWGIDIGREAIEFGAVAFARPNLTFAILDIENPPTRELSRFEVILAIEILEHLKNYQRGLGMIKKFFSTKGTSMGFITTPNINNPETKERDAENPLHLNHWTAGDFYKIMIDNFQEVTFYSADKLDKWNIKETVDGNTKDGLIVAKVMGAK